MASKVILSTVLFFTLCGAVFSSSCTNPEVSATSFTSKDATIVTHIAFITEFTLNCDSPLPKNYALYAEVDNKPLTAARIGDNKYQVSWTEKVGAAKSGDREVHIYDEEGWGALRRTRRSEAGATVAPLVTIQLNHPGSYSGPWVNSEVMAAGLSVLVAYTAIRNKSKLLA